MNRRAAGERRRSALEASDNGGAEKAGAEWVREGGEGGRGTFSNHHCLYIHVLAAVGVYEALPQLETHQCILVSQPEQEGQGERGRGRETGRGGRRREAVIGERGREAVIGERGRDRERRKRERQGKEKEGETGKGGRGRDRERERETGRGGRRRETGKGGRGREIGRQVYTVTLYNVTRCLTFSATVMAMRALM